MASAKEDAVQRRLTKAFIDGDPATLILTPQAKTPNGSGGYVLASQPPRVPQTMRMVRVNGQIEERQTADGRVLNVGFELVCEADAEVAEFDQFDYSGLRFEIVYVNPLPTYEKKCQVVYLGPAS